MPTVQDAIKALGTCLTGAESARIIRVHSSHVGNQHSPGFLDVLLSGNVRDAITRLEEAQQKALRLADSLETDHPERICRGDRTGGVKSDLFNSIVYAISDMYAAAQTVGTTTVIMESAREEFVDVAISQAKKVVGYGLGTLILIAGSVFVISWSLNRGQ